jgi:hypothetical protein
VIDSINAASKSRAELISKSLKRHRLVFVQFGAAFEPLRSSTLQELRGAQSTVELRDTWSELAEPTQTLIVTDVERCADTSSGAVGEIRELVLSLLDQGKMVCLVSRAPRIAFRSVPGSSVFEDAALVTLPLLDETEVQVAGEEKRGPGWEWPSVTFGAPLDTTTYRNALAEFGQGLVAALDHALFEVDPRGSGGIEFLAPRELEGLRGSGIIRISGDGEASLAMPHSAKILREALATHVSETVSPASILTEVTSGLWYSERKIRTALRAAAIEKYGVAWRESVVGGLKGEVLRRAQLDTSVTAKSVKDLRDPLEWLTLSELMDIVRGEKFSNLGVEPAIWRKLQEQLVPIRNRLAHVRMLKSEDAEVVSMWASLIRSRFE